MVSENDRWTGAAKPPNVLCLLCWTLYAWVSGEWVNYGRLQSSIVGRLGDCCLLPAWPFPCPCSCSGFNALCSCLLLNKMCVESSARSDCFWIKVFKEVLPYLLLSLKQHRNNPSVQMALHLKKRERVCVCVYDLANICTQAGPWHPTELSKQEKNKTKHRTLKYGVVLCINVLLVQGSYLM